MLTINSLRKGPCFDKLLKRGRDKLKETTLTVRWPPFHEPKSIESVFDAFSLLLSSSFKEHFRDLELIWFVENFNNGTLKAGIYQSPNTIFLNYALLKMSYGKVFGTFIHESMHHLEYREKVPEFSFPKLNVPYFLSYLMPVLYGLKEGETFATLVSIAFLDPEQVISITTFQDLKPSPKALEMIENFMGWEGIFDRALDLRIVDIYYRELEKLSKLF